MGQTIISISIANLADRGTPWLGVARPNPVAVDAAKATPPCAWLSMVTSFPTHQESLHCWRQRGHQRFACDHLVLIDVFFSHPVGREPPLEALADPTPV